MEAVKETRVRVAGAITVYDGGYLFLIEVVKLTNPYEATLETSEIEKRSHASGSARLVVPFWF